MIGGSSAAGGDPQAGYGILKPRLLRAGNGGSQLGHRPDRRNPRVIMALCQACPLAVAWRACGSAAPAVYQRSCLVLCGAPVQQAAPPPGRGRLLPSQRWCLAGRDRATSDRRRCGKASSSLCGRFRRRYNAARSPAPPPSRVGVTSQQHRQPKQWPVLRVVQIGPSRADVVRGWSAPPSRSALV